LHFIYGERGEPSKEQSSEDYQSDQFGVYGEFYGLFGYACLPLLFAGAYLVKRVYVRLRSSNPFILLMKRVVVLYVFDRLVNSYGIDWIIGETIPLVAAIFLYTFFFSVRRSGRADVGERLPDVGGEPLPRFPTASR
jgi:hypothetical protein